MKSGDWVRVSSARGELTVRALVTPRMKTLKIGGREVTVVWMPYNWGYQRSFHRSQRESPHNRCCRSGSGHPRNQGVSGECGQGRARPRKIANRAKGRSMMTPRTPRLLSRRRWSTSRNASVVERVRLPASSGTIAREKQTEFQWDLGFQNPASLSAKTLTLITFHEVPDEKAPGGLHYLFTMRRCLHCLEPACVSACPTTALHPAIRRTRNLRCQ